MYLPGLNSRIKRYTFRKQRDDTKQASVNRCVSLKTKRKQKACRRLNTWQATDRHLQAVVSLFTHRGSEECSPIIETNGHYLSNH